MTTFETKCMRCEKLIKYDFEKTFHPIKTEEDKKNAHLRIANTHRLMNMCPHCKQKTFQIIVTPLDIKNPIITMKPVIKP